MRLIRNLTLLLAVLSKCAVAIEHDEPILNDNRIGDRHRKLILDSILDFLFGFLPGFKTCRSVSDTQLETAELNIISYLFAIIFGGEDVGECDVDKCSDFCNSQSCFDFADGTCTCRTNCDPSPGTSSPGQVCSSDDSCSQGVCRSGVCVATSDCNLLKHNAGDPFDVDRINLIIVGSMFDTDQQFTDAVDNLFDTMKTFEFFDQSVDLYNVMYVLPDEGQESSFCTQPCNGIDRLLCCDIPTANRLAQRCIDPYTENVQKLVLHNSVVYGGAGYISSNVATATIHNVADLIMIHEIGHSLFNLGDEYVGSTSTAQYAPNCDTSGCDKWSDMIDNTPTGYAPVTCTGGRCSNSNFFVGEYSFMDMLHLPIGAVNARFSCCTYLAYTKTTPAFCSKFEFSSGALLAYCQDNDYQFYGSDSYTRQKGQPVASSSLLSISLPDHVGNPILTISPTTSNPRSNQDILFFPSIDEAFGSVFVVEFTIIGIPDTVQLIVSATTEVHVPLPSNGGDDGSLSESLRIASNFVQVEVAYPPNDIESTTVEFVDIV